MMSAEQAMEKAVSYEEKGNMKMAEFYLRIAIRKEQPTTCNLQDTWNAIQSAQRSVTGSIHF